MAIEDQRIFLTFLIVGGIYGIVMSFIAISSVGAIFIVAGFSILGAIIYSNTQPNPFVLGFFGIIIGLTFEITIERTEQAVAMMENNIDTNWVIFSSLFWFGIWAIPAFILNREITK